MQRKAKVLGAKVVRRTSENGAERKIVLLSVEPSTEIPSGIIEITLNSVVDNNGFESESMAIKAVKTAISKQSAMVTFDLVENKAGESWVDRRTGRTGVYGEKNGGKSWFRTKNVDLVMPESVIRQTVLTNSQAFMDAFIQENKALLKVDASAFSGMFGLAPAEPTPVVQQPVIEPEPEQEEVLNEELPG